jgi:hypothetical protein
MVNSDVIRYLYDAYNKLPATKKYKMKFGFYIFIFALLFCSCNKNDNNKHEPRKPVLAGINDFDMIYNEFNPPFQVNFNSDSMLKYGADSIDLNLDGKFDLMISQRFFIDWHDSLQINYYNYPYCKLTLKNDLVVAKKNEVFYIGLGQTSNVDWVDTLYFEYRIDNIPEWSEANSYIWMWVIPPTEFWGSYGSWYNLSNAIRYIGIRMKIDSDHKFGWIKLKQINRENLEFLSYAIEK